MKHQSLFQCFIFCAYVTCTYSFDVIVNVSDNNQTDVDDALNATSRYLDDLLNIDLYFEQMVSQIYPTELQLNNSKKEGKDQESIQSSTTPDPGYKWESENFTIRHHKRKPRGQPFPNFIDTESPFFDLDLSITNGIVSSKIYDKQDDFNFKIVNFPFLDGDVPRPPSYGVYISQFIHFERVYICPNIGDFKNGNQFLSY